VHADGAIYIGKEANNIDDQPLEIWQAQVFLNKRAYPLSFCLIRHHVAKQKTIMGSHLIKIFIPWGNLIVYSLK
jgi:hypothetical protein